MRKPLTLCPLSCYLLTMTPATQELLWTPWGSQWTFPIDPTADDSRITWQTSVPEGWPDEWPGIGMLLDDFCDLERAQPAEMAAFVARYGAPELGKDQWLSRGGGSSGWLSVSALREHARAFSAARRLGAALVMRRPGDREDWFRLDGAGIPTRGARTMWSDLEDWKLGRERFADWLTLLMRELDVATTAQWRGVRGLALDPSPGTLLGAIALLLAREVGAEGQYVCDSCGASVQRVRPPREGEAVYCDRAECKREQKRRNQAAWRAKKAAEQREA